MHEHIVDIKLHADGTSEKPDIIGSYRIHDVLDLGAEQLVIQPDT